MMARKSITVEEERQCPILIEVRCLSLKLLGISMAIAKEGTLLDWKGFFHWFACLVDDKSCQCMSDCIDEAGVAEVYAEDPTVQENSDDEEVGDGGSDYEHEMEETSEKEARDEEDELVESREGIERQV